MVRCLSPATSFSDSRVSSSNPKMGMENRKESGYDVVPPRISKILSLIRFIKEKGQRASPADLHFLGSLREKAGQLGYSC